MKTLYPEIEPYDQGMLGVGDANSIYWMQSGNPNGVPVVILHGGPGSGSSAGAAVATVCRTRQSRRAIFLPISHGTWLPISSG